MKVILLEKLKNLGEVGKLVDVKSGYARNFLVPNKKAVIATAKNITEFEAKKEQLAELSKKREAAAQKIADKIKGSIVPSIKQAGDDGRLYGAVVSSEIASELSKTAGTAIDRKQINISTAIKAIGVYEVSVDLGEGVISYIHVNVARNESEAGEQKAKFASGKIKAGAIAAESGNRKKEENEEKPAAVATATPEAEEAAA